MHHGYAQHLCVEANPCKTGIQTHSSIAKHLKNITAVVVCCFDHPARGFSQKRVFQVFLFFFEK
jgi:hypothetical protein